VEPLRGPQDDEFLGVGELAPEPTPDVRSDHPQLVVSKARPTEHQMLDDVGCLRRDPRGVAGAGRLDDDGARLHRRREHAWLLESSPHDDLGGSERLVYVAVLAGSIDHGVGRARLVELSGARGDGGHGVRHDRKRFVVGIDQLRSISGLRRCTRDDDSHRLAGVAHHVDREQRHVRSVVEARQYRAPRRDVAARPRAEHARGLPRRRQVDAESCVRVRAAHEHENSGARHPDVGGPGRATGDEVTVLGAKDAGRALRIVVCRRHRHRSSAGSVTGNWQTK
jgi:hypothetical protein